jgi:mannose-6-phosphate isomerase-like protein (cupin superfamily)
MRAALVSLTILTAACGSPASAGLHHVKLALSPAPVEQMLLNGPPQTAGMVAGRVVLKPGEAMHRHSTENNEELLIVLHGRGQVVFGREPVTIAAGEVLYVPPRTEHEVRNDGPEELRYIFTAAPVGR